ncbi:tRNA adenosine deaminase-associated protein [Jatrophihabitans sp. YIM 134969]
MTATTSDSVGFAVAVSRSEGRWRVEPLPPTVLDDLTVLLAALRSQPSEGGPFVAAAVDDEFFVLARMDGPKIALLLSDLTAAVEYPLAEQVLERLGEEPPDEDELDEVWPIGDLDLLSDLGVSEDDLTDIVDDLDAYPDEMLEEIAERLDIAEDYLAAVRTVSPARR